MLRRDLRYLRVGKRTNLASGEGSDCLKTYPCEEARADNGKKRALFAASVVFAFIVMYDAAGIRQAAGKQARVLNQMVDELFGEKHQFSEEKLKELLGHTPIQVIAGAVLGSVFACASFTIWAI